MVKLVEEYSAPAASTPRREPIWARVVATPRAGRPDLAAVPVARQRQALAEASCPAFRPTGSGRGSPCSSPASGRSCAAPWTARYKEKRNEIPFPGLALALAWPRPAQSAAPAPAPARWAWTRSWAPPVPLDLVLNDEDGEPITLGQLIDKPTILTLNYFRCAGICTPLLNGLLDGLNAPQAEPAKDFQVITVSFDERDTPRWPR